MNITRAHLHAMTLEVVAKRGKTDPMPKQEVDGILFKLKTDLDTLKLGKADDALLYSLCEGFLLPAWAARDVRANEGRELIKQRQVACDTAYKVLCAMRSEKRYIAKGSELKALDGGFTAVVELYDNLPEWCFLQAGLDLIKLSMGRHRKTKGRKKK